MVIPPLLALFSHGRWHGQGRRERRILRVANIPVLTGRQELVMEWYLPVRWIDFGARTARLTSPASSSNGDNDNDNNPTHGPYSPRYMRMRGFQHPDPPPTPLHVGKNGLSDTPSCIIGWGKKGTGSGAVSRLVTPAPPLSLSIIPSFTIPVSLPIP
ncbi:hypothetical protein BJ684DRAFT_14723 [Piptocephalis cylindrospora]|uniref:Uncharacterized protein n=1 Tax=Piptocephalis cylindrospora TaxID=1907219 RepID=A0A4P9Y794_9FUNG|nr:hypothetical protein BJ684DRAFT_14723 [Piptocephalis cylindrospora]|eukprot:RKP14998.1 hypothetical protein BJ684DRAFT_14723 [Piptocephalis cylindrospora]